jgi:hypothetical protein
MSLPTLKKLVHHFSTTDVANMVNIMQTTYTVLQSSPVLGEDTLSKGRKTFQCLCSRFVTDLVKVRYYFYSMR